MLSRIFAVYRKEMIDNLRDRRSVAMALLFPLLGAGTIAMMLMLMGRVSEDFSKEPLKIGVMGAERAPALMDFLAGENVEAAEVDDPAVAVRDGGKPAVLVIPDGWQQALATGRPAPVELYHDASRQKASAAVRRIRALVRSWGVQHGAVRLLARGISPDTMFAVEVREVDLSTPESRAMLALGMAPYFIVFAVFMGGLYVAIDTTAGERERSTLESLVVHAIPRWGLLLGKSLATMTFAFVALVETLVGFGLLPLLVPMERLGIALRLDPGVLASILVLLLPFLVWASAGQMVIASFARGFKEAQTSLSFVMILPIIPGMMLMISPVDPEAWMFVVPLLSEQLLIQALLRGEALEATWVALSMGMGLTLATLLGGIAAWLYRGERLVFGR